MARQIFTCKEPILTALLLERKKEIPPTLPVDKDLSVPKSSPHFSSLFYSVGGKGFSCGRSPGARSPLLQRNKSISFGKKGRGGNPSHSWRARCPGYSGRSGAQSSAFLERAREPTVSSKGRGTSFAFGKEGESPPFSLSALPLSLEKIPH